MQTKIFEIIEIDDRSTDKLKEAATILRNGGLVAFPTETVYGLGADAMNAEAVERIYLAKGRPSDNPIIIHIAGADMLSILTSSESEDMHVLAERFWPGPLTLVLPKRPQVPDVTTGGLSTVAVRMPDNPVALELIRKSGCPVAAPSANISGRPSPTKGEHVIVDLSGRVDAIILSGDCSVGIESTVLDLTGNLPVVLRPGIITPEQLTDVLRKKVVVDPGVLAQSQYDGTAYDEPPRAPGMKYTHYAPKAEMIILNGERHDVIIGMNKMRSEAEAEGKKVGIILFEESEPEKAAHGFFARLRELDEEGADIILAAALNSRDSVGLAVMNRMLKAAGYKMINV